jgi:hypothetical protein
VSPARPPAASPKSGIAAKPAQVPRSAPLLSKPAPSSGDEPPESTGSPGPKKKGGKAIVLVPLVLLFICCGGVGALAFIVRDSISSQLAKLREKSAGEGVTESAVTAPQIETRKRLPKEEPPAEKPPVDVAQLKELLLGKWASTEGKDKASLEFLPDGSAIVAMPGSPPMKGKYRLLDDGMLEVELTLPSGEQTIQKLKIKVSKEELTTTDEKNHVDRFARVAADKDSLDLSYIAADFNVTVIMHGQRIAKSPLLMALPQEEMLAEMIKETGIDPRKVERAILLLEPTPGGNVLFFPGGIIRFVGPVDGKAILAKALKDTEDATAGGKTYSKSKTEMMAKVPIAGYVANDRTILIAPEPTLKKMLTAGKAKSPLIDHLRRIDLDSDVIVTFAMEPVRPMVGELLKQAKDQVPPPLTEVTNLHERLNFATLSVNLSGETLLKLVLDAKNEESATALKDLVTQGRNFAQLIYPEVRKKLAAQAPPGVMPPITAVTDQMLDGITVSQNGAQVVVNLKTPKGLAELPAKLLPLLKGGSAPPPPPDVKQEPALPPKPLPKPAATGDSVKGDSKDLMGLKVTDIKLPSKTTLPCLTWANAKGSAFFALDGTGVLRRISFPESAETARIDLGEKCSWLGLSVEGLVLSLPGPGEVWVLDPEKLEMTQRYAIPKVKRVAAAPSLDLAVASNGPELFVLDLKKKTWFQFPGPGPQFGGFDDPAVTPDGRYVFTRGGINQLHRFRLANGQLTFEESSPRIISGPAGSISVSPDSRFVCIPSGSGNAGAKRSYSTFVYSVTSFKKAVFMLAQGAYPRAVAFDPAAAHVYAQDFKHPLIIFTATGIKQREYALGRSGEVRQYLVHPEGNRLLLLTEGSLSYVEIPKE